MDSAIRKPSSISARLTVMVASILALAVLVAGSMALLGQERELNQALETKATSLLQFMAQVSPISVLSLNFVDMHHNARKVVLTDQDAVCAVIVNEKGVPLAYFFKPSDPMVSKDVRDLVDKK